MHIFERINWVDILVVILIIRISYVAFKEGLTREIFPLIGSIIIVLFTLHYYVRLGGWISRSLFNAPLAFSNFLAFITLFIAIALVLKLVNAVLGNILKIEWHPVIERFGGLIAGILRGAVTASLVLIILALAPLPYLRWSIRDRSLMGMRFLRIGPDIYTVLSGPLSITIKKGGSETMRESVIENIITDKASPARDRKSTAVSMTPEGM